MLRRLLLGQRKRQEIAAKESNDSFGVTKPFSSQAKDLDYEVETKENLCESESEESDTETEDGEDNVSDTSGDSSSCSLDDSSDDYNTVHEWEGFEMADAHAAKKESKLLKICGNNNGILNVQGKSRSPKEQSEIKGAHTMLGETLNTEMESKAIKNSEGCDEDKRIYLERSESDENDERKVNEGHCDISIGKNKGCPSLEDFRNPEYAEVGNDDENINDSKDNKNDNDNEYNKNRKNDNSDNNRQNNNNSSNNINNISINENNNNDNNNNSNDNSNNNNNNSKNNSSNNNNNNNGNNNSKSNSNNGKCNNNNNNNINNSNNNHNKNKYNIDNNNKNNKVNGYNSKNITDKKKPNPNDNKTKGKQSPKSTVNSKPSPYVKPVSSNMKASPGIFRHYSFSSSEKHSTPSSINHHKKIYRDHSSGVKRISSEKATKPRTRSFTSENVVTKKPPRAIPQDRRVRNVKDREGNRRITNVPSGQKLRAQQVCRNKGEKKSMQCKKKITTVMQVKAQKSADNFETGVSVFDFTEHQDVIKNVEPSNGQKNEQTNRTGGRPEEEPTSRIMESESSQSDETTGIPSETNGSFEDVKLGLGKDLEDILKGVRKSVKRHGQFNGQNNQLFEIRRSPDGCQSEGCEYVQRIEGSKDEVSGDSGLSETDANSPGSQRFMSVKDIIKRKDCLRKEVADLDARVVVMREHRKDIQFVYDLFDLCNDEVKEVERNNVGVPCVLSLKEILGRQIQEMGDEEFQAKMKGLQSKGVPYFKTIYQHIEKIRLKIHHSLQDGSKFGSKAVQKMRFEIGKVLGMCEGLLDCVYQE